MRVSDLFSISGGHQLSGRELTPTSTPQDAIAYVTRSHRNNGVGAWVEPITGLVPAKAGDLSVCLRSRNHTLSTFVQPRDFYTTYHVAILSPKQEMSLEEKLWWGLCIRANRFRFNFGRQANRTLGSLELPDQLPTWVDQLSPSSPTTVLERQKAEEINTADWLSFRIFDLFEPSSGKQGPRRDMTPGTTPLVTASRVNNGITALVDREPQWNGGQITVASNGSVGAAFYQALPFCASSDVMVLTPKHPLSSASAMFICALLRRESIMFNYARKWTMGRMQKSTIKLPVLDGNPDYAKMESIIRSLPLGWAVAEQANP
jgi:hypothetical protein